MPPRCLTSPFVLGTVDPDIIVFGGPALVRRGREAITMNEAKVFITCRPKISPRFEGEGESKDAIWLERTVEGWEPRRFTFADRHGRGVLYRNTASVGGDFRSVPFTLSASGHVMEFTLGGARRLKSVLFHLPNFLEYIGEHVTDGNGSWRGRLTLDDGNWQLTIDQRRDFTALEKALGEGGGYAITHLCMLDKHGDRFDTEEANEVIESLHWFFSFARGAWTSPILYVGQPVSRGSEWMRLTDGRFHPWRGSFTWCDQFEPQALKDAFVGYRRLWGQAHWRQGLRTAIGLYITANRPDPLEVAIIAAQSGLELLGWLTFVESGRVAAADWQNASNYPAHRKIRDLLAEGKIDPALPRKLSPLVGLDSNWTDGPSVVAGVRNRLVHPRRAGGAVAWPTDVLRDAWLLSSRYLELVLLHALGVTGRIRDRLGSPYAGATIKPPWV